VVLQRDARVRIWGWASDGEIVAIRFLDSTYPTTAEIALKLGMHNPLEWVDQVV
jgi:sialate O-acetylesterase